MAEKKNKKSANSGNEIFENPEVLAEKVSKTEEFIEKNPYLFGGIFLAIIILAGGFYGYRYLQNDKNDTAQAEMFQAVYYFESDSIDLAIKGDGNNLGFEEIVASYGSTKAGNLASYYLGASLMKKGQYQEALDNLSNFSSNDLLVQAKAYGLIGSCHAELGNFSEAASYFEKAANHNANKYFSPGYLIQAGIMYELDKNNDSAIKCYDKIIKDFFDAAEIAEAKKKKARLTGSAS